jgi:hypothetical protein
MGATASEGLTQLRDATESLLQQHADKPERALSVSVPYLQLCGVVLGGALAARASVLAEAALQETPQDAFYAAKLQTGQFYAEQLLPATLDRG